MRLDITRKIQKMDILTSKFNTDILLMLLVTGVATIVDCRSWTQLSLNNFNQLLNQAPSNIKHKNIHVQY